jgi:hypothetical protein
VAAGTFGFSQSWRDDSPDTTTDLIELGQGAPSTRCAESQILPFLEQTNKAARLSVQQWSVSNWPDNFSDLNHSGVSFLLTDLDLAMTFMDVADASRSEETTRRNHTNARTAYDAVRRLLEKLMPNADQRQAIDAKLASLKTRLQAVGQQF